MIGEPEMEGDEGAPAAPGASPFADRPRSPLPAPLPGTDPGSAPGTAPRAEVLSGAGRPPRPARLKPLLLRLRDRPWAWAACAVVMTSAVWAGALAGTGYGRTSAPDLHGYHVGDGNPCTYLNLRPLTDHLGARAFGQMPPTIAHSDALDHVECRLTADSEDDGDGWTSTYTVAVTVDLHKKTDPSTEFDADGEVVGQHPHIPGTMFLVVDIPERTTHPRGLGDRANLVSSQFRQSLGVRHGGAVFTLTLTGTNEWDPAHGAEPDSDSRPPVIDTTGQTKDLVPAMRTLMAALSS
ncbi:hypothetical protein [Streptomyces sp. NRRL F-5123]|uniref:hypothetical protein n=1 Tax=Streptomyces sp. NRRL F-5123 TaxID=1463856 RepID=UPI0004E1D0F0|nr:hypothetical protein [Streptomyces sp. NRRL F-5123]